MAKYTGNNPPSSDGWEMIATAFDENDIEWLAFAKHSSCGEWLNIKLVANGTVEKKANYWFGFNVMTKGYNRSRDLALLKENRNQLFCDIDVILKHW